MNDIIEKYKFTEYLQENKDFVRGSHDTYEDGNYKFAPNVPALYIIKHIPTGKFYVGQTISLGRRISHHFGSLKNNKHACYRLQNLFNESSENDFMFKYTIINNDKERIDLEEYILKKYSNSSSLLNTVINGGTWIHERNSERVEEFSKKISESSKARVGELNSFYGKNHSDESKQKMRESKIGSENPSCWKSVVVNGKYYKNLESASIDLGIPIVTVSHRVNNEKYVYCNYYEPIDEKDIKVVDERLLFDPKIKDIKIAYDIEGKIYFSGKDVLKDYPELKGASSVSYRIKSSNPKFKNWKKII